MAASMAWELSTSAGALGQRRGLHIGGTNEDIQPIIGRRRQRNGTYAFGALRPTLHC